MFSSEKVDSAGKVHTASGTVKTCLEPLLEKLPPSFAMKKGGDFGKIPRGCPSGYFRRGWLCF